MGKITLDEQEKLHVNQNSQLCIGLMAISLLILQSLLSGTSLDTAQFISLIAFSVAIPLLTVEILLHRTLLLRGSYTERLRFLSLIGIVISSSITIVGIIADIWHLSWICSLVFVAVSISGIVFYLQSDYFSYT